MKEDVSLYERWRWTVIALVVGVFFGIPLFFFFVLITGGAILIPLMGVAFLAPFVLLHYLLWGRAAEREVAEMSADEIAARLGGDDSSGEAGP